MKKSKSNENVNVTKFKRYITFLETAASHIGVHSMIKLLICHKAFSGILGNDDHSSQNGDSYKIKPERAHVGIFISCAVSHVQSVEELHVLKHTNIAQKFLKKTQSSR